MIKFGKLVRSFRHAFCGIGYMLQGQNFVIELAAGVLAIALALWLPVAHFELVAIIMIVFLVLILETINTIFERIIDILQPRLHPYAKIIKDMMAGAVLMSAVAALVVGMVIFIPYLSKIVPDFFNFGK